MAQQNDNRRHLIVGGGKGNFSPPQGDAVSECLIPTHPKARRLFQLVEELGIPFGYERSFRVTRGMISPDRFLLSLSKSSLEEKPKPAAFELFQSLCMPDVALEKAKGELTSAGFVHLGFEAGASSCLYKVYLEYPLRIATKEDRERRLLHTAFKWDADNSSHFVVSRYTYYPGLSLTEITQRVSAIYGDSHQESLDIAMDIFHFADARTKTGGLRYLEVGEEGNARKSFDVNLYDAKLTLDDIQPFLLRMAAHYAVPSETLRSITETAQNRLLGHLAGGIHRGGEDFFNVYYGVEGRRGPKADS